MERMNNSSIPKPVSLEELERESTLYWMNAKKMVNEDKRRMNFRDFYFLIDLYNDRSKKIAIKKSAQSGVSTWAIFRSLHDSRYRGINQMHLLPSDSDVQKFVPSKTNQIINENACLKNKMSKEDRDSIGQKKMGKGFLFYKGTNSKTAGIMLSSDRNIYDEYDKANFDNLKDFESRLEGAYSLGEEWWISTPTLPMFAIDAKYEESDQKNMRWNCHHCGHRQHFMWPESVNFDDQCYQCQECGGEIDNTVFPEMQEAWDIRWEAKYPDREISGYQINQMMVPWKTARDLIKEYRDAEKEGQLDNFFNFNLGLAYLSTDTKVSAGLIYKNLTSQEFVELDSIMGVDVQGTELYVIIGNKEAIYGITKCVDEFDETTGKLIRNKWDRLAELMEVYRVRICVIDATFKPNDVKAFAERFPYKVYMNWYHPDPKREKIYRFGDDRKFTDKKIEFDEEIKVYTDRERSIDSMLTKLDAGTPKIAYAKHDKELQVLIKHCETMYARIIENKDGTKRREWANTGKNDYFHAMVYYTAGVHRAGLFDNT